MINLTRLNNQGLTVNSDLIKFVEQSPDTVITLITGEKIVVRESAQVVLERLIEFRRLVLQNLVSQNLVSQNLPPQGLPLAWDSSCSHLPPPPDAGVKKIVKKTEPEQ
jgi:flagellar protein FlbD